MILVAAILIGFAWCGRIAAKISFFSRTWDHDITMGDNSIGTSGRNYSRSDMIR